MKLSQKIRNVKRKNDVWFVNKERVDKLQSRHKKVHDKKIERTLTDDEFWQKLKTTLNRIED